MVDKKKPITREIVKQAWVGAVGGVILFAVIFPAFIFGWGAWWSYMIAAFIVMGPITTTLTFLSQEKLRCPYCGTELDSQAKVCSQCGREIFSACPACQRQIKWGSRFCEFCGAKLNELADKARGQVATPEVTPQAIQVAPSKPTAIFCPTCGEQITDGAKFCFRCGTAVSTP